MARSRLRDNAGRSASPESPAAAAGSALVSDDELSAGADGYGQLLRAEQAETDALLVGLRRDFAAMLEAAAWTTADDEHDPEGATIAFERAQIAAMIGEAEQRLVDLHAAADRLAQDAYGDCLRCGRPIREQRLRARPASQHCLDCAATATRR